jgi:hypothetical protein
MFPLSPGVTWDVLTHSPMLKILVIYQYRGHYGWLEQTLYKGSETVFAKARISEIRTNILEEDKKYALGITTSTSFTKTTDRLWDRDTPRIARFGRGAMLYMSTETCQV